MGKVDTKKKVWVLTYETNDYDQHGEYFVAVFEKAPTIEQLIDNTQSRQTLNSVDALLKFCLHLQKGGGRMGSEQVWYNLNKVELQ